MGHSIEPLAPSLFAFALKDARLSDLAGLSVPMATVKLLPKGSKQSGPLLITHPSGLSGPSILRLSAWEARALQVHVSINSRYLLTGWAIREAIRF